MALRAVVLPAPLGPMRPRMRPSSTRMSTLSRATVAPKALRRPRASMQAMSALLLYIVGRSGPLAAVEQLVRRQSQPPDGCVHPRPLLGQKLLALALHQQI